jgi:phosphoribosylaminoimidazole (AIR) synthetase
MVLVVAPHVADSIWQQLADLGYENWKIGTVTAATADQDRVVLQ